MSRIIHSLLLAGLLLCFGSGCAHFIEAQTIDHFTVALQKKDLPSLKSSTSETFEQKTLRLAESLDDFKIINLPQGKTSIVKVENVTEDEKRVTVEVGESKRKLLYKLTHDREAQKWVVDDIYVKQKKKGMTSARSVTEQMDLLLTVREFLAAWDQGDRNQALSVTTPEFGQLLSELPPAYFARLARQVVGEKSRTSTFRPEAELDADVAIVQLPRSTGRMVLTFKLLDEAWKVSDIAVEAGGEGKDIPSVLKMATALQASLSFLEAYHAEDNRTLAKVCTKKFYRSSLAYADLTTVELPRANQIQNKYKVKMQGGRADFVVSGESEIVRLTLKRSNPDSDSSAPPDYLVEDVTIYELESTQEKRLSSLFTAHAVMQIFSDALAKRDLNRLRKTSTADFNRRIWKKLDDSILTELPLSEIEQVAPRVLSTTFQGAITEITVMQGQRALTYVLRDRAGQVLVDDVLVPATERPTSLKKTLEFMLPIRYFSAAISPSRFEQLQLSSGMEISQIELLQQTSSKDFNRLVWKQTQQIPDIGLQAQPYLQAPLTSIRLGDEEVLVTLGDNRWGARVMLINEQTHWVVDEVLLIAGSEPQQRAHLKQTMRDQMANGMFNPKRSPQVSALQPRQVAVPQPYAAPQIPAIELTGAREPASQSAVLLLDPSPTAFTPPADEPTYRFAPASR